MIDPELKEHLEKIEDEIIHMRKKSTSIWNALWIGIVYGAGYIVGVVLLIVIVGWILNIFGFIPAINRLAEELSAALATYSGR